jgi:hypothetical protein
MMRPLEAGNEPGPEQAPHQRSNPHHLALIGVGRGGTKFFVGLGDQLLGAFCVATELAVVIVLGCTDGLEGGDQILLGVAEISVVPADVDDWSVLGLQGDLSCTKHDGCYGDYVEQFAFHYVLLKIV